MSIFKDNTTYVIEEQTHLVSRSACLDEHNSTPPLFGASDDPHGSDLGLYPDINNISFQNLNQVAPFYAQEHHQQDAGPNLGGLYVHPSMPSASEALILASFDY